MGKDSLPGPEETHNVLDALVLGSDGAEGGGNDGLVEGDEENGHAERADDDGEFEARGIDGGVGASVGCGFNSIVACLLHDARNTPRWLLVYEAVVARRFDLCRRPVARMVRGRHDGGGGDVDDGDDVVASCDEAVTFS